MPSKFVEFVSLPHIETAREELSILTGLSNKIARALDFPHRLRIRTGRLDAASDESPPPLTIFSG